MSKRNRRKKQRSKQTDAGTKATSTLVEGNQTTRRSPVVFLLILGFAVAAGVILRSTSEEELEPTSAAAQAHDREETVEEDAGEKDADIGIQAATYQGSGSKQELIPATELALTREKSTHSGLDPASAGWQSEAFNDQASLQLKKLAHLIEVPADRSEKAAAKLIAKDFRTTPLRPANTREVFRDGSVIVSRSEQEIQTAASLRGKQGLIEAIRTLPEPDVGDGFHVKFKVIGVTNADAQGLATTQVYAEGGGPGTEGLTQWRATWNCTWATPEKAPPLLRSISVERFEQVDSPQNNQPWLVDCGPAVLGGDPSYREQLAYGMEYWLRHVEGRLGVSRLGHNGIALGDVNNDGREDLYVCQTGGLPNRLFLAQADGTARDIAKQAGVDILDDSTCALLVDLDNDGNQDLALMTISGGLILSGDGEGNFTTRAILPDCRNAFSLTAADYDNDSLLDLYVGRYWPTSENRGDIPIPVPYYDAQNGGRNVLYRSTGEWKFEDVTEQTGLDVENTRYTMAAAWNDYDQDGRIDLYVANDFGRNCLYRNEGGSFTNVAAEAGVEDSASGMSVTFADYDRDGLDDIYVSNMFSSAGSRTTYQRQYEEKFGESGVRSMQRMARGNTLFRNLGGGNFEDVSLSADVTMGRWAWGSLFADLNNDSWDDLVVLNGNITTEDTGDL